MIISDLFHFHLICEKVCDTVAVIPKCQVAGNANIHPQVGLGQAKHQHHGANNVEEVYKVVAQKDREEGTDGKQKEKLQLNQLQLPKGNMK